MIKDRAHFAVYDPLPDAFKRLQAELAEQKSINIMLKECLRDETEDVEALRRKLYALAPHETCGCAWDKPDDVCEHHSPAVMKLQAELAEVTREREGYVLCKNAPVGYMHPTLDKAISIGDLAFQAPDVQAEWRTGQPLCAAAPAYRGSK